MQLVEGMRALAAIALMFGANAQADEPKYGKVETFQPGKKYTCVPTADHKGWDCNEIAPGSASGKQSSNAPPAETTPLAPTTAARAPEPMPPVPASIPAAPPPPVAAPTQPKPSGLPSYLRAGGSNPPAQAAPVPASPTPAAPPAPAPEPAAPPAARPDAERPATPAVAEPPPAPAATAAPPSTFSDVTPATTPTPNASVPSAPAPPTPAASATAQPTAQATPAPPAPAEPAAATPDRVAPTPASEPAAAPQPVPAAPTSTPRPAHEPIAAPPAREAEQPAPAAPPVPAEAAPAPTAAQSPPPQAPAKSAPAAARGNHEFLALPASDYVIELAHSANAADLAALHASLQLRRGELYELHLHRDSGDWWLLVWGNFDSVDAARAARAELPADAAINAGWPRRIGVLQSEARRVSSSQD